MVVSLPAQRTNPFVCASVTCIKHSTQPAFRPQSEQLRWTTECTYIWWFMVTTLWMVGKRLLFVGFSWALWDVSLRVLYNCARYTTDLLCWIVCECWAVINYRSFQGCFFSNQVVAEIVSRVHTVRYWPWFCRLRRILSIPKDSYNPRPKPVVFDV